MESDVDAAASSADPEKRQRRETQLSAPANPEPIIIAPVYVVPSTSNLYPVALEADTDRLWQKMNVAVPLKNAPKLLDRFFGSHGQFEHDSYEVHPSVLNQILDRFRSADPVDHFFNVRILEMSRPSPIRSKMFSAGRWQDALQDLRRSWTSIKKRRVDLLADEITGTNTRSANSRHDHVWYDRSVRRLSVRQLLNYPLLPAFAMPTEAQYPTLEVLYFDKLTSLLAVDHRRTLHLPERVNVTLKLDLLRPPQMPREQIADPAGLKFPTFDQGQEPDQQTKERLIACLALLDTMPGDRLYSVQWRTLEWALKRENIGKWEEEVVDEYELFAEERQQLSTGWTQTHPLAEMFVRARVGRIFPWSRGGILAAAPGFGKTLIMLSLAALDEAGDKTLVLVPKSGLIDQWMERAEAFFPGHFYIKKYTAATSKMAMDHRLSRTRRVLIIAPHSAMTWPVFQVARWKRVVVDECHQDISDSQRPRTGGEACNRLFQLSTRFIQPSSRWLLTGTPNLDATGLEIMANIMQGSLMAEDASQQRLRFVERYLLHMPELHSEIVEAMLTRMSGGASVSSDEVTGEICEMASSDGKEGLKFKLNPIGISLSGFEMEQYQRLRNHNRKQANAAKDSVTTFFGLADLGRGEAQTSLVGLLEQTKEAAKKADEAVQRIRDQLVAHGDCESAAANVVNESASGEGGSSSSSQPPSQPPNQPPTAEVARLRSALVAATHRQRNANFMMNSIDVLAAQDDETAICPICHDALKMQLDEEGGGQAPVRIYKCGHAFHEACSTSWLLTRKICPTCRKPCKEDEGFLFHGDGLKNAGNSSRTLLGPKVYFLLERLRLLRDRGVKSVLIFTNYDTMASALLSFAGAALQGERIELMEANSGTASKRSNRMRQFVRRVAELESSESQPEEMVVMAMSMESNGSGLDLYTTSHVIFLQPPDAHSASDKRRRLHQAIARVLRPGQKKRVTVDLLFCKHTDEHERAEEACNVLRGNGVSV